MDQLRREYQCKQTAAAQDHCIMIKVIRIFNHRNIKLLCEKINRNPRYLSSVSNWSDIEQADYKRSLKRVKNSGFESESEQIAASLSDLSGQSANEWNPWDDNIEPKGELTGAIPLRKLKGKSIYNRRNIFVDVKRVNCRGGDGGDGKIAFLRLFCNPHAGPSGGDGGNGAHIIFEASSQIKSLSGISSVYRGEKGEDGMHKDMHGANAEHTTIQVPVGTLVKDLETKRIIADLDQDRIKFIAARGGSGGKGNHYFLSDSNRHPRVAEFGAKGEVRNYLLEMKLVAHAGLVGFPNAGKSTLLSAISRAKPKVASYPFTTLKPNIGIIQYDDYEQLAVADLPGLIVDAHKNKGLGIDFLKHVERCVCLFYVIDISEDEPWNQLDALMHELEQFRTGLSKRPNAIVCNKIDMPNAEKNFQEFKKRIQDNDSELKIVSISAKYGHNIAQLLRLLRDYYDLYNYNEDTECGLKW